MANMDFDCAGDLSEDVCIPKDWHPSRDVNRDKSDCRLDLFDHTKLTSPSVHQRPIKVIATGNIRHAGLASQRFRDDRFLSGLRKLASPNTTGQNLKTVNRHVVILVVCNVAKALTSRKQREFLN
jgi:hypothetical protein